MAVQQYCLRWNNHQPNFISMFTSLLNSESLVDVTLAAEGKHIQAHKVVLSACSSYFQSLFTLNPCQHPIVILKDIKYTDLKVMVDFMYCGEVNVSQEQLPAILKTAETLKVKGLAEMPEQNISLSKSVSISSDKSCDSPSMRRKRLRKSSTGSGSGSGSTEHTGTVTGGSEETVGSVEIPIVKTEPASEGEHSLRNEPSTESEPGFTSQESVEEESQQVNEKSKSENNSLETVHQSSTEEQTPTPAMGSKRGRLLIRQNRIKKDCEGDDIVMVGGLAVPRIIERQCSEPGPSTPQSSPNLLTVPQPAYLVKQHSSPLLSTPTTPQVQVHLAGPAEPPVTASIRVRTDELRRASSTPQSSTSSLPEGSRSCHCPVLRPGPALGCNFCWNTIDAHGRILRRKTKYHCPECQTNLCIVPCFQEYHERHGAGSGLTDLTTTATGTIVPTIMKTSSMG
ncbi:longitudinals lacking protein, isoforms H/M/V-like [Macrosteles quadrilineatus]|uniref:longitudinals lacking protein, isoforms H/M/V-like n=1 Tax=Macrosteles quadrilineatus TaxID=74068 RepID=UPI0023E1A406|nr:longitudinals lacking protein, isoforms H/M/V-like [Macrosteles quadrilineatus]